MKCGGGGICGDIGVVGYLGVGVWDSGQLTSLHGTNQAPTAPYLYFYLYLYLYGTCISIVFVGT